MKINKNKTKKKNKRKRKGEEIEESVFWMRSSCPGVAQEHVSPGWGVFIQQGHGSIREEEV
ncbi:hypothetical protein EYF80_018136 [Liparis tanakae]|uniref:Uncharacterized protein n=1 Tax=Liparis tanakae TaxID=230148 RepID=A0A4Z2I1B4_9TELE|nr:hypothetical protein EYF80_018136 [Liparis tanakae]